MKKIIYSQCKEHAEFHVPSCSPAFKGQHVELNTGTESQNNSNNNNYNKGTKPATCWCTYMISNPQIS